MAWPGLAWPRRRDPRAAAAASAAASSGDSDPEAPRGPEAARAAAQARWGGPARRPRSSRPPPRPAPEQPPRYKHLPQFINNKLLGHGRKGKVVLTTGKELHVREHEQRPANGRALPRRRGGGSSPRCPPTPRYRERNSERLVHSKTGGTAGRGGR